MGTANAVMRHESSRCGFVFVASKKEPANASVLGPCFTIVGSEEVIANLRDIVEGHDCGVVDDRRGGLPVQ